MSKSLKTLTLGLSGVAIATLCSTVIAPSAFAFTFANNTVGVTTEDINKTFTVQFDGNVATQGVSGLSSEATFKFLGFTANPITTTTSVTTFVTTGKKKTAVTELVTTTVAQTIAQFEIVLKNSSSGAIGSRVSGIGFNTDKQEVAASTSAVSPTSKALFASGVLNGKLPNGFGNVDVCYSDGNCAGGQNGGVSNNSTLPGVFRRGSFLANLTLSGAVNSFTMSNLGVRYQSITGTSLGNSGTGKSVALFVPPVTPPRPKKVPEPTAITALVVTGLVALRLRKKQQEACEAA